MTTTKITDAHKSQIRTAVRCGNTYKADTRQPLRLYAACIVANKTGDFDAGMERLCS